MNCPTHQRRCEIARLHHGKSVFLGQLPEPARASVQRAGLVTLAMTDQDFDVPMAQLAQSLQTQGVHLAIKRRDTKVVLLAR